eukprot:CAMPEP_0196725642 /NCGR_PEP_ID=MMETSP1091-20130531/7121_1 /TAXON_ID=302021 /ORGANISM="Rhodomonas sp., Strain CCMP768" /LENGTH=602 /DNA_ID=CAMNT_0042067941 /DNA_START=189 /DNA_END=1997 /DNA_ORIENTATION=+
MAATIDPKVELDTPTLKLDALKEKEAEIARPFPLDKELPLQKLDGKPTVIVTGASSGIGLQAAAALANEKGWHVIMAVRSYSKAVRAAREMNMDPNSFTIMNLDLASLDSVRDFVNNLRLIGRRVDALVCNAAVWYPMDKEPRLTVDGFEEAVGTNHLAHFLLCNLLLGDLPEGTGRVLFIGTETANDGLAGKIPPVADLGTLDGMIDGMKKTIDGLDFEPTKAYKDSKVCNAVVMREMNKRYGKTRGLTVNAMFPGCIAESPLFRQKRGWFRWLFPRFQKYVTKQFVPEEVAGRRVAECIADEDKKVGGAYWKWNAQSGKDFERIEEGFMGQKEAAANLVQIPAEALDELTAEAVWDLSAALVGFGVAPDVTAAQDGSSLTLQGKYIRADATRAEILLQQMRKDLAGLKDQSKMMEVVNDMDGETTRVAEKLYYWGRRQYAPKVEFRGDAESPASELRVMFSEDKPRKDEAAADILLQNLKRKIPLADFAPGITISDERADAAVKGEKFFKPEEKMTVGVEQAYPETDKSMALMREMIPEQLGSEAREELDMVSREEVMEWTAKMEEARRPPSGLDAELFGERDSFKRLLLETVSKGLIKN